MPQIATILTSKSDRLKQIRAIKKIESTKRPGENVQLMIKNVAVTMPVRRVIA